MQHLLENKRQIKQMKFTFLIIILFLSNVLNALPPTLVSVSPTDPLCIGIDNGSIVISATGTGTIQYSIDNGANFQSSNIFSNLAPGSYDVVVQDITGTTSQTVVLSYQKTVISSFIPSILSGDAVLDVDFTNTSLGAFTYNWNLDGANMNSTLTNPSFSYDVPGVYNVTLIASDGSCKDTSSSTITVTGVSSIGVIANIFSPNGDGINDNFFIPNVGMKSLEVYIFNRYGNVVYQWTGKNGFWDGHTYPSGQPVPDGSYFYYLKATGFDAVEYDLNGELTLLRNKTD
jgi:gliding motility-associated-like protein